MFVSNGRRDTIEFQFLDIMRQVTDSDITQPDFRVELAERVRLGINSVLERWENFGGIEEVYFTEFVIQ